MRTYQNDPAFDSPNSGDELKHFVGRPSPIYHAKRWSETLGGAQIFLKREDLNHTGAHKINNVIGQALLARKHGQEARHRRNRRRPCTAWPRRRSAARFGMECVVYMGAEDVAAPGAATSTA